LAGAYNLGPDTHTSASVRDVITLARQTYERGEIEWGQAHKGPHEAATLTLEIAKARNVLCIQPRWSLEESVGRTMTWYKRQGLGEDAAALCRSDIADFARASASPTSLLNTSLP
jgi:CDP-glucose 4,6-dehydratase